ncbi:MULTISPECIES: S-layer homology domain-containing protein [Cohnella]|uniref:S-layer homology domain-containing protein n=1 Tax=Cohnella TaxID=329857 RepID=UPI0009BBBBE2|nr:MULTISPECIES: S-layer homology domain-containing protein [Cohnella]MBN2984110.1 S-layer homology domain-containing protein [Cohnella algarum]
MKKSLIWLLSALLVVALSPSVFAFSDTSSSKHADKINALKEKGVISGVGKDKFDPDGELSYAAGISMINKGLDISLARFLFVKAPLASDYFTNVPDDAWYSDAFIVAHINGLEIPQDVKPDQSMTREQFAHHLFLGMEANGAHAYPEPYILIDDEADVNPSYMNSIQKLLISNVASLEDGKFNPKAPITRGEAAEWLYNAMEFVQNTPQVDPNPEEPDPLADYKLEVKPVNESVSEVTVKATAPHPGYGLRIVSIQFEGDQAIVFTEPVWPDPEMMYPQVLTEISAVTYVDAKLKPVLPQDAVSSPSDGEASESSASASVSS